MCGPPSCSVSVSQTQLGLLAPCRPEVAMPRRRAATDLLAAAHPAPGVASARSPSPPHASRGLARQYERQSSYQSVSTSSCRMVAAASRAWLAAVIASVTSSDDGPGANALGYSKLLRARRMRLKDRNARTVEPNWARAASWIAICPPRLVARNPCTASRLAALLGTRHRRADMPRTGRPRMRQRRVLPGGGWHRRGDARRYDGRA